MKIIVILILLVVTLSGCGTFNLSGWIMPGDLEFLAVIENLDTPEKICNYMKENFTYKEHPFYAPDPYTTWQIKEGDCNDLAIFAIFIANYHGYKVYQIHIHFKGTFIKHFLAVYIENGKYTYSNIKAYCPICADTFEEVISDFFKTCFEYELRKYKVYDYEMNLVEEGH